MQLSMMCATIRVIMAWHLLTLIQEILEQLRSQLLSSISAASLASLRQLADKMEKILLVSLENYGNTFVEPKVELGARFGHLVCKLCPCLQTRSFPLTCVSAIPRHLPGHSGFE